MRSNRKAPFAWYFLTFSRPKNYQYGVDIACPYALFRSIFSSVTISMKSAPQVLLYVVRFRGVLCFQRPDFPPLQRRQTAETARAETTPPPRAGTKTSRSWGTDSAALPSSPPHSIYTIYTTAAHVPRGKRGNPARDWKSRAGFTLFWDKFHVEEMGPPEMQRNDYKTYRFFAKFPESGLAWERRKLQKCL